MKSSKDHCKRTLRLVPQRNVIITLKSESQRLISADAFERSRLAPARSKVQAPKETNPSGLRYLMTLKQACSSEYQGAQGAFKDSMIH